MRLASAGVDDCDIPGYMGDLGVRTEASIHYHPTFVIVVYARPAGETTPAGQVKKLIVPPPLLGVHTLTSRLTDNWIYRQLHSHDGNGVLHVEPAEGRIFRVCQLFKLWSLANGASQSFGEFDPRKPVTIIIGEEHLENRTYDELLMTPLNSDKQIFVLVEEGRLM